MKMEVLNMNQLTPKQPARRGRIFPELTLSPWIFKLVFWV